MKEELIACDSELYHEGGNRKLIIGCRECDKNFNFKDCLSGIVLALEGKYNIDTVILSDFIESQYSEVSLDILKDLRDISEEMDRLSSRKTDGKECDECRINPAVMYPTMKEILLNDHEGIYEKFLEYSKEVMMLEGCTHCRKAAKEELTVLGSELLEFRSKVLLDAYGVLG